ncbi:cystatin-like [Rhinatrema bivittatum]|uniref:cystatin-like n=1 Tax=Rhinatrema bivittatum TaxID=194408 RepID=UPI0011270CFF|nr:cystatin-like [Rhinatrema bivittatum]
MANFWLCLSVILSFSVLSSSADGAPETIDPNNPDVQKAASFAVNTYNEKSGNEYLFRVIKVLSAESQIVAGVKYILDVEIGKTQCKTGSTDNAASCPFFDTAGQTETFLCHFEILEQAWLNKQTVLESSCKPAGQ